MNYDLGIFTLLVVWLVIDIFDFRPHRKKGPRTIVVLAKDREEEQFAVGIITKIEREI